MKMWKHCTVCNSNYPYGQLVCYKCIRNMQVDTSQKINWLETSFAKSLKTQTGEALPYLIRLHNDYPLPEELQVYGDCYTCKKQSYCSNFGNYKHYCPAEEQVLCSCRECCQKAKNYYKEKDRKK